MALVEPWLLSHFVLYYLSPCYDNALRGEVEAGKQNASVQHAGRYYISIEALLIVSLRVHAAEC